MPHGKRQTIWIEDTTSYMPVEAAHNLAAQHYSRDIRSKLQGNGGKGADGNNGAGTRGVKELSKWTTAHPMASVSCVLMQSVEPLEDFITGGTELTPTPNPATPSKAEVRIAVARRRMLGRERAQKVLAFSGYANVIPERQDQPQPCCEDSQNVNNVGKVTAATVDSGSEPSATAIDTECQSEKKLDQRTDTAELNGAAAVPSVEPAELLPEGTQDSRLIMPMLESLIALRRSRLTRVIPLSTQPQQSSYPSARSPSMSMNGGGGGGGSTTTGDAAPWCSVAGSPPAAVKPAATKSYRRFGFPMQSTTTTASGVATSGPPPESPTTATATGGSRSQVMLSGPSVMQPLPLSQFPGPFCSTRKWEVFLPDCPCSSVVTAPGVSTSGPSTHAASRGADATAASSTPQAPGLSWAGNEGSMERAAASAGGTYTAGFKPGSSAALCPAPPRSPPSTAVASPKTPGGATDASVSVHRTSRFSPRTSIELGLGSCLDETLEDFGGLPRSVTRQRALLQEWLEWQESGGLGPPPGIDEETDYGHCITARRGKGGDDGDRETDDDDEEDDENDDNQDEKEGEEDEDTFGGGLMLGLIRQRAGTKSAVSPGASVPQAATAAVGQSAAVRLISAYDASQENRKSTYRRARRTTQSLDVLGLEGFTSTGWEARTGSMSAPLGIAASSASPLGIVIIPASPPVATQSALLSGMSTPTSALSPISVQGRGSAPLSPMACRRRIESNSGRPGMGPLALPMWLNKALDSGGATADPAGAGATEDVLSYEDGGHGSGGSTASTPTATTATTTNPRIPSLTGAKHLSFTSKFNRFKERIQRFTLTQATPSREPQQGVKRAQSLLSTGAAGNRPHVPVSNDGRSPFSAAATTAAAAATDFTPAMVRQAQGRKGAAGAGSISSRATSSDLSIRPTPRASLDFYPPGLKSQQIQPYLESDGGGGGGSSSSTVVRMSGRHSLDSRLSTSRGRPGLDGASGGMPALPGTLANSVVGLPAQQGLQETLLVSNAGDRSRRGGDSSIHQVSGLFPFMQLL